MPLFGLPNSKWAQELKELVAQKLLDRLAPLVEEHFIKSNDKHAEAKIRADGSKHAALIRSRATVLTSMFALCGTFFLYQREKYEKRFRDKQAELARAELEIADQYLQSVERDATIMYKDTQIAGLEANLSSAESYVDQSKLPQHEQNKLETQAWQNFNNAEIDRFYKQNMSDVMLARHIRRFEDEVKASEQDPGPTVFSILNAHR